VPISDYITTLSVTLDSDLTLNKHVGKLAYYSIKALRHIWPVASTYIWYGQIELSRHR